ncbi:MAG: rod shape-determining protein MreD [Pseudomonadota bacterium]
MRETFEQRVDRWGRAMTPMVIAALLVLLATARDPDLGVSAVAPNMALICVYFWSAQRPEAMSPAAAFALGLFQDLLTGFAPGVNAMTLLLAHVLVAGQLRFLLSQSFLVAWCAFAIFAIGAEALRGGLFWFFADRPPDLAEAGLRVAVTTALHPFFAWALGKLDGRLYRDEA